VVARVKSAKSWIQGWNGRMIFGNKKRRKKDTQRKTARAFWPGAIFGGKRRPALAAGVRITFFAAVLLLPLFIAFFNGSVLSITPEREPAESGGAVVAGTSTSAEPAAPPQTPVPATAQASDRSTTQTPDQTPPPDASSSSDRGQAPEPRDAAAGAAPEPDVAPDAVPDAGNNAAPTEPTGSALLEPEIARVIYITIDDGPSRAITPGILDVLMEKGVPATFFVLPRQNVDDLYIRMIDEGHEIGNHSFSHNYTRLYQSDNLDAFRDDVLDAHEFIMKNFGYVTMAYRFPGGSLGRSASIVAPRQEILDELGYRYYNWHIDVGDARSDLPDRSAAEMTSAALNGTRGREHVIILLHDSAGMSTTLQALPGIIDGLREQGYTFDVLRNYPEGKPP